MRPSLLVSIVGRCALAAVAWVFTMSVASADMWPSRPIKWIVPFPPGGGADALARMLSERLRAKLGQTVVLENKTGAGSNIGTEFVAKSAPDGYTFLINTDAIAIYPQLYANLRYDPFKDLAPVTFVASSPLLLAVHPSVPGKTVKEFVETAKREASKINFANPGQGSPHHLAFELLARTAGIEIGQANYRGGGPALNDVVAGHAQVGMFTYGAVRQFVQGGQLKPLALLTEKRSELAPDMPTVVEAGWPGVHVALRFVVMAPAGTPADITARLHAAIAEVSKEPDYLQQLRQAGFEAFVTSPSDTGALLRGESTRWAPILKSSGIRLD